MSYKFPKRRLNKDGLFGPTTENHYYKPVNYHNKAAAPNRHKTTWVLNQHEQFEVFRVSDENKWFCKNSKGLFSILENGKLIMGSNEERLSFFPKPINTTDPYHGYPVDSSEYEPCTELVDKWLDDKVIDDRLHIKILKGQI